MAGELSFVAHIGLDAVKSVLYEDETPEESDWLKECHLSWADAKNIVIGNKCRFAVLRESGRSRFEVIGRGSEILLQTDNRVDSTEEHDQLTAISSTFYQPVKSDEPILVILAGYASGHFRVFTEHGRMLLSQQLHTSPIRRIKHQPSSGAEDIVLLHTKVLVIVDGFALMHTVRGCISRLGHGFDLQADEIPPLSMKRWGLDAQQQCDDFVCFGSELPAAYDNLISNRTVSEHINRYIVCGQSSMLTGYSTAGCEKQHFSATALATDVATKLGSAMISVVSSFWGGGSGAPQKPAEKKQKLAKNNPDTPITKLRCEFELTDPRRHIVSACLSPDDRNLLTTDKFGRVMLFDVGMATFTRIWKGYRDAECGWLVAEESSYQEGELETVSQNNSSRSSGGGGGGDTRRCAFVIIHAARRGLVEVWAPWFGHRVAAFNVGLGCKLVSFGRKRDSESATKSRKFRKGGGCALVCPDGTLKRFTVPFESTLSVAIGLANQDLVQMRRMQSLLKPFNTSTPIVCSLQQLETRVVESITSLRSVSGITEAFDLVASTYQLPDSLVHASMQAFRQAFNVVCHQGTHQSGGDTSETTTTITTTTTTTTTKVVPPTAVDECADTEGFSSVAACRLNNLLTRRENQIASHASLISQCTTPLQLLVPPVNTEAAKPPPQQQQHQQQQQQQHQQQHQHQQQQQQQQLATICLPHLAAMGLASEEDDVELLEKALALRMQCIDEGNDNPHGKESSSHVKIIGNGDDDGAALMAKPKQLELNTFLTYLNRCAHITRTHSTEKSGRNSSSPLRDGGMLTDHEVCLTAAFCFQPILSGCFSVERLKSALEGLGIDGVQMLKLYLEWSFSLPLWCLLRQPVLEGAQSVLGVIIAMIQTQSTEASTTPVKESDAPVKDSDAPVDWGEVFRYECTNTSRIVQALVASMVARRVTHAHGWGHHIARLEDAVFLQLVLHSRGTSCPPVSGLLAPDRVARTISNHFIAQNGKHQDLIEDADMAKAKAKLSVPQSPSELYGSVREQLLLLQHRFPVSTSITSLSLRCSSKCVGLWSLNTTSMAMLLDGVNFLRRCRNTTLKRAFGYALYVQYLQKPFGKLYNLIEKVGKAPKERLCQKHLDLDYPNTTLFAEAAYVAIALLQLPHTDVVDSEAELPPITDERWRGDVVDTELVLLGKTSVGDAVEAAVHLRTEMIRYHKLLSYVMFLIVKFQMRFRPSTLFPARVRAMFFAPFDKEHPDFSEVKSHSPSSSSFSSTTSSPSNANTQQHDTANLMYDDPEQARLAAEIAELRSSRRQFLMRVMDEVVVEDPVIEPNMCQAITPKHIFELAHAFNLPDDDQLRRHYARNLFRSGNPADAKDVLTQVVDTDAMASVLFSSCVRDLAVLIDPNNSDDALKLVARLPVYVYEWCQASVVAFPNPTGCVASGAMDMSYIYDVIQCAESLASANCHDRDRIVRLRDALEPA